MAFKPALLLVTVSVSSLLLAGCTTTGPIDPPASSTPKASAAPAATKCAASVTADFPTDIVEVKSCIQLAETKEREDVNLPDISLGNVLFASGDVAVYSAIIKGGQTSADTHLLYGYTAGKKVWEIKLDGSGENFAAQMVDGVPQIRVQVPVSDPGDAVNKASASFRFDFYTFDGKKVKSLDGIKGSAIYDDENSEVKDASADANADSSTGYISTNDGLYYADPENDKLTFLTSDGWTHTIKGGYAAGDGYGANAYITNRFILGYNTDGYLSDEYASLDHTSKTDPSNFQFTTWAGKVLWTVPVSHDDGNSGAVATVYGSIAHVQYAEYLDGGNVGPAFEGWINIESGKQLDPTEIAAKVKPYLGFAPNNDRAPEVMLATDGSIVYSLFSRDGGYLDGQSQQVAIGSDGTKHSLDESETRKALNFDGVSGSTFYNSDGLRYNATSDKPTISDEKGDFQPSISAADGAYFTADGKVYFIKYAA